MLFAIGDLQGVEIADTRQQRLVKNFVARFEVRGLLLPNGEGGAPLAQAGLKIGKGKTASPLAAGRLSDTSNDRSPDLHFL